MKKTTLIIILFTSLLLLRIATRIDFTIGRATDNNGTGKAYNGEAYYNYINYSRTEAKQDDIVLTVLILNPLNNYPDDDIARLDYILLHDTPQADTRQITMEVDTITDKETTLIDTQGNIWVEEGTLYGAEQGSLYQVTLDTQGTDDITDDIPLTYSRL